MTKQTKELTMEKRTSLEASVIGEFISKYLTTILFVVAAFVIGMLFAEPFWLHSPQKYKVKQGVLC